ncbi:NAD(P)H-hydrate dehydratase [Methanobrevibacter sp.]|uniref:NAD(P)H-hydrate dehydratase n=1 Tax=Methanobrevibacter sp. TaxID=66852 RepID=UPI0034CDCA04
MSPLDMKITDINCECLGLSRLCLMESAGKSLAEEVGKIAVYTFSKPVKVAIFTGSGGNGGDGFVAARYLLNRGYEVDIYNLNPTIKDENARINYEILLSMKPRLSHLNIYNLDSVEDIENTQIAQSESFSEFIIIDAILGTGIRGKLRPKVRKAIEVINESNGLTISVDVPSGLNPENGEISDIAVDPEYTVSFHKIKDGVELAGEELTGGSVICDIGIPIEAEYFTGIGDLLRLKNRSDASHKGNNGKLLIVGGSKDYFGAPAIAGLSAISAGADLVYIATPTPAALPVKLTSPDFIVRELEGDYLGLEHLDEIMDLVDSVDAVLIGPGAGRCEGTSKLFNVLAAKIKKPMVIDADALKEVDINLVKNNENLILTPHLFEFKAFFDKVIKELGIRSNDFKIADATNFNMVDGTVTAFQRIVREIKGTVIIKGEYDFIVNRKRFKINKTGNPGMTVGGTGDALAGLTASLFSQGLDAFDASIVAAYVNGRAGDVAFEKDGYGFSATDLTKNIGSILLNG